MHKLLLTTLIAVVGVAGCPKGEEKPPTGAAAPAPTSPAKAAPPAKVAPPAAGPAAGAPASPVALGCFKDAEDRDLPTQAGEEKMTTARCAGLCAAKGFALAGTQHGTQCWCGNSYGRHGKATNCDTPCDGNPAEKCGGDWALSVYFLGKGPAPAPFTYPKVATTALGCYKDADERDLPEMLGEHSMSVAKCAALCAAKRFAYAGLQNGNQCWCGNSYGKHGKAANCDAPCTGNPAEKCGGDWAQSIYRLGK